MSKTSAEMMDLEMLKVVKEVVDITKTREQAAMVIFLAHEAGVIMDDEAETLSAEQGVAFPYYN